MLHKIFNGRSIWSDQAKKDRSLKNDNKYAKPKNRLRLLTQRNRQLKRRMKRNRYPQKQPRPLKLQKVLQASRNNPKLEIKGVRLTNVPQPTEKAGRRILS
jgi:hypothetical protein